MVPHSSKFELVARQGKLRANVRGVFHGSTVSLTAASCLCAADWAERESSPRVIGRARRIPLHFRLR
ncbi:MAG: hypothetical protein DWH97_01335 [Planctomycetota bacterium]|nr:MAG: hypothetical protein DWH97_01335 [Planctomycetota bacterium]RLS96735.1 MAG: hypothetical protein DWI12_01505 [Planctomycetota bacterium]